MQRSCDVCGRTYEAKRASSKYDSELCRKRAQRNGLARPAASAPRRAARSPKPKQSPPAAARVDAPPADETPAAKATAIGLVTPAVLDELTKLQVQDTAVGRVALALAVRLDTSTVDTASAVASLGKTLIEAVKSATEVAKPKDDPMDEFSRRLQQKLSGA